MKVIGLGFWGPECVPVVLNASKYRPVLLKKWLDNMDGLKAELDGDDRELIIIISDAAHFETATKLADRIVVAETPDVLEGLGVDVIDGEKTGDVWVQKDINLNEIETSLNLKDNYKYSEKRVSEAVKSKALAHGKLNYLLSQVEDTFSSPVPNFRETMLMFLAGITSKHKFTDKQKKAAKVGNKELLDELTTFMDSKYGRNLWRSTYYVVKQGQNKKKICDKYKVDEHDLELLIKELSLDRYSSFVYTP